MSHQVSPAALAVTKSPNSLFDRGIDADTCTAKWHFQSAPAL